MAGALDLPPGAAQYLPVLVSEIKSEWADVPYPSVLAAQIEQESGWKTGATARNPKNNGEIGAGLAQMTKTNKFDAIGELKAKYPSKLKGWSWANPYDVEYQLRGNVLKNRDNYRSITWAKDSFQRMAMMDAAYNQGAGGVRMRRRLCANTPGCDPSIWFGNMEFASTQSHKPIPGYKQSFADITRTHVNNVMFVRRYKYLFMDEDGEK